MHIWLAEIHFRRPEIYFRNASLGDRCALLVARNVFPMAGSLATGIAFLATRNAHLAFRDAFLKYISGHQKLIPDNQMCISGDQKILLAAITIFLVSRNGYQVCISGKCIPWGRTMVAQKCTPRHQLTVLVTRNIFPVARIYFWVQNCISGHQKYPPVQKVAFQTETKPFWGWGPNLGQGVGHPWSIIVAMTIPERK